MTPDALARMLPECWSLASSGKWHAENPAAGQCSVTALLAHELLGGEILKTRVGADWHFYNVLDDARRDFTESQFDTPISYDDEASDRAEAMTDTSPEQYAALRSRVLAGVAA
jgi:hypothetical protein